MIKIIKKGLTNAFDNLFSQNTLIIIVGIISIACIYVVYIKMINGDDPIKETKKVRIQRR